MTLLKNKYFNGFIVFLVLIFLLMLFQGDAVYSLFFSEVGQTTTGEMYLYNSTGYLFPIPSHSIYYNLSNLTQGELYNVNFSDGYLIINEPGLYSVDYSISFSGGANNVYGIAIYHNENNARDCYTRRKLGAGGDVGNAGGTCTLNMTKTDYINMRLEDETNPATNISIVSVNINLDKIEAGERIINITNYETINNTINQTINQTIENPFITNFSNGTTTKQAENGSIINLLSGFGINVFQSDLNFSFYFTLADELNQTDEIEGINNTKVDTYTCPKNSASQNRTAHGGDCIPITNDTNTDWWQFENNQFISPNETRLTIVTPNGSVPYGNAWHDIGAFGGVILPLDTHSYNRGFYDDLFQWRGDTANMPYQTANNVIQAPQMDGVVAENVQCTHRNAPEHVLVTYQDGYKATEFFQGNERYGSAVGQIMNPMHFSYTYPYLSTYIYPIVFNRPFVINYTPSFVCTCGFDVNNYDWFYSGGEAICSFMALTNTGVTGVCTYKDGTDGAGERVAPEGNKVMNWQVVSEEDLGYNQQGTEILYIEGGIP